MGGALLIGIHLLAGCVSCPYEPPTAVLTAPSASLPTLKDPEAVGVVFNTSPDSVFPILVTAYEEVGLDPDFVSRPDRVVASRGMALSGQLGGHRLGTFLYCGSATDGRPLADETRIVAGVISRVSSRGLWGLSSELRTRIEAYAFPQDGAGTLQDCVSTGRLEDMILARVLASIEDESASDSTALRETSRPCGGAPTLSLPIEAGQRVRAKLGPQESVAGGLLYACADSLILTRGEARDEILFSDVQRLEVLRERPSFGRHGMIIGGVTGALVGLVTTEAGGEHWKTQGRILGPGLGAIFGGLLGGFLGSKIRGDYWEELPIDDIWPRLSVSFEGVEMRAHIPWLGPR